MNYFKVDLMINLLTMHPASYKSTYEINKSDSETNNDMLWSLLLSVISEN